MVLDSSEGMVGDTADMVGVSEKFNFSSIYFEQFCDQATDAGMAEAMEEATEATVIIEFIRKIRRIQ